MGGLFSAPKPPPLPPVETAPQPPKATDPNVEAARRAEIIAATAARGRAQTAFGGLKADPILGEGATVERKALLGV